MQISATSHTSQFNVELHETQPFVALQFSPNRQHPADPVGLINLLELQVVHFEDTSHLVQLKVDGQATHPTPLLILQVNYVRQHPTEVDKAGKKL